MSILNKIDNEHVHVEFAWSAYACIVVACTGSFDITKACIVGKMNFIQIK